MTTYNTRVVPSVFNELRKDPFLVGFDQFFDRLVSTGVGAASQAASYPPYNIVKKSETEFEIQLAVAGFDEDEIEVTIHEDVLAVESKKDHSASGGGESYIHQGIAERNFKRKWTLSPTIEVVGATFKNGFLTVKLQNKVPESEKPRVIKLNSQGTAEGPQFLNE